MGMKFTEKGIHDLYAEDPVSADKALWGREVDPVSRRGFLKKSSLLAMSSVLGMGIPFAKNLSGGIIPAALANSDEPFKIPGKMDRNFNAPFPVMRRMDRNFNAPFPVMRRI